MSEPVPIPELAPAPVVYEQPLNERMRAFLRLDFLWQQATYHSGNGNAWSSRAALSSLLEILAITARGDSRGEVFKELERQMSALRDYHNRQGVDASVLRNILANLVRRREALNAVGGNFLQKLRDSEFLNAIKHRSAIPGGTCEFDLPDYTHWLSQDAQARNADLEVWMGTIRPLCECIGELLWVTRQNARTKREVAPNGVFQIAFEREQPIQMLRITVPGGSGLYPEVSGSHHRCSVRFLLWTDVHSRPAQAQGDVPFLLTSCT